MSDVITKGERAPLPQVTMAEVARHATPDDCWIVIRGKVYDASRWADQHPGGAVVHAFAGRDATDLFTTFHGPRGWKELASRAVAEIAEPAPESPLLDEFRSLRARFTREGLFKSRKAYYGLKLASTVGILALAVALLVVGARAASPLAAWTALAASAGATGLFWQQCGWLAHDFCHHQVFASRAVNDLFALLVGGVFQGFSVDWLKTKHNLHHAAPNELDAAKEAIDPDIATLPLFAWSPEMLEAVKSPRHLALLRVQHWFFFPALAFARFNWAADSVVRAVRLASRHPSGLREVLALALHYGGVFAVLLVFLPVPQALGYFVAAQAASGAMLAIVFVQSHSGMEVYSTRKDFVTAQLASTRDIDPSPFVDWFTGGLNYQIEHHLFPTMPRHNLAKVRPAIRALCAKHGLTYESCGMRESTRRVVRSLAEIAAYASSEGARSGGTSQGEGA